MYTGWQLLLVALAYLGLLFLVAWAGDRRPLYPAHGWLRPIVYSLALAVYCTSWTFFGAVGTAATRGLTYLPIYLGPILLFVAFGARFQRLVDIAQARNITSIADFIASRYGRSPGLAALVTLIALTAAVPYVALQFKAVAMGIDVLTATGGREAGPWFADTAFAVALVLALFAIAFGTRAIDATEHHHGLMLAIALESVVKLVAFVAVGLWSLRLLGGAEPLPRPDVALPFDAADLGSPAFLTQLLLAFCAGFCLPRQFQVGVVECEDPRDVTRARVVFPLYLAVFCALVVPIALAGVRSAPPAGVHPDSFVLWLPQSRGHDGLALLGFLGGFSAATGMVIVVSVALATMLSNEVVLPALSRLRLVDLERGGDLSRLVLWIRRAAILALALFGFAYYRYSVDAPSLASVGLLAFAAVAQFAPAIVAGLLFRGASREGATAGLAAGFAVWLWMLLLPSVSHAGFGGSDAIAHGALWSLGTNVVVFALVALRYPVNVQQRTQARAFLEAGAATAGLAGAPATGRARVGELLDLVGRIVGPAAAQRALEDYAQQSGRRIDVDAIADRPLLLQVERLLAAALGATSARLMLVSALRGTGLEVDEVAALLDETSQELRFSRGLLQTTMENVAQGISVVDADLRLVAWNRRYLELFPYPEGMVHVGCPIESLIRFNAERGEWGPGDPEEHVAKRLEHLRRATPYRFQRVRADGSVIEMRGQPMPGGGFVTTYTDVTDFKRVEQELRDATELLERRVEERTQELATALDAQRAAKLEAEAANLSKTRFLAAASHDLLQPLNAARLFASALRERPAADAEGGALAERIDAALRGAEELLDALLDVSRLDAGALRAEPARFALADLFDALRDQFAPIAARRGLDLRVRATTLAVTSDRRLLRRVLQNLIGNALRYTARGSVLLAARARGDDVEILVVDTGPGIAPEHREAIFEEFHRLDQASPWGEKGLGLGLSICDRVARLLGHPLRLQSTPGRGSTFSVRVPRARGAAPAAAVEAPATAQALAPARVLCLDNDREILDGMRALLSRWGLGVETAGCVAEAERALAAARPDLILADYHLGESLDGLAALDRLRALAGAAPPPGALVTADASDALREAARARGYAVLYKPVKPAALRALIGALASPRPPAP